MSTTLNSGNLNFLKAVKGVVKIDVTKSLNRSLQILTPTLEYGSVIVNPL
jgi:hypothetical protein